MKEFLVLILFFAFIMFMVYLSIKGVNFKKDDKDDDSSEDV